MRRKSEQQDVVAIERSFNFDAAIQALVGNAVRETRASLFREIGEHFMALSRGHTIPKQEVIERLKPNRVAVKVESKDENNEKSSPKEDSVSKLRKDSHKLYHAVFNSICSFCGFAFGKQVSIECPSIPSTKETQLQRVKHFVSFVHEHGNEAARKEFRLRCRSCCGGRGEAGWPGMKKAKIIQTRVLGEVCCKCHKNTTKRNKIIDGPGHDRNVMLRSFAALVLAGKEEEAKRQFSIICRTCLQRGHFAGRVVRKSA